MDLEREPVVVGTPDEGLTLSNVAFLDDGTLLSVHVEVHVAGVRAGLAMHSNIHNDFDDLVEFFDGLATDWRGWAGTRDYQSLEGDLLIEATHRGHVSLKVVLRSHLHDWSVSARFRVDPGEQLSRASGDLRALLRRT